MSTIPTYALNSFLEIIQAYGAFLKERAIVKKIIKDESINKTLSSELNYNKKDYYSYEYKEYGTVSGLSDSSIQEIKKSISNIITEKKSNLTKNLISTEKYYKKLKHEFNNDFPELNELLTDKLKEYQEYMENKKRKTHQKNKMIEEMSPSFISFFHYQFGGSDGSKIAYQDFSFKVNKKYNLTPNNIEDLHNRMDIDDPKGIKTLSAKEIDVLFSILDKFIKNIKDSDFLFEDDGNPEKTKLKHDIVIKEYNRFKKLHSKYISIIKA